MMPSPEELARAREMFPAFAWMLDVPELADIITRATNEQWVEERILAAVQGTGWWRARTEAARAFAQLQQTDPASAQQRVNDLAREMRQWATRNGFVLTPEEAEHIAGLTLVYGVTSPAEWQGNLLNIFAQRGDVAEPIVDQLSALAADYAVPLSAQTLSEWQDLVLSGSADVDTFRAYLKEQAKSLFPGLANALDRGITVAQYVAPYREIAVQELGINPSEIDWRDPKWSVAIHRIDPQTGEPRALSLAEWTRELRSNEIYGFQNTQRAIEQASMLGRGLAEMMGRAA